VSRFAEKTSVAPERTRIEIEAVLRRYQADQFGYAWDSTRGLAMVSFRVADRTVRILVKMPDPAAEEFTHVTMRGGYRKKRTPLQAHEQWDQAVRQRWRALLLVLKAKLEAVDSGISTLEEEFLAWLVLRDGRTIGEVALPQLDSAGETGLRLLPGPPP
jgi:hypothetical protein